MILPERRGRMDEDSIRMELKDSHEELYGLLLLANQKISNVGTLLIWIMSLAALALCVTIHMRWAPAILGIPIDDLRGFGVYSLIFIAVFLLWWLVIRYQEQKVYRGLKPELMSCLQDNELSVQVLLARIVDDDDLEDVREQMLDDPSLLPASGRGQAH